MHSLGLRSMESFYSTAKGLSSTCNSLQRRVLSPAPSRGEDKLAGPDLHLTGKSPKCPKLLLRERADGRHERSSTALAYLACCAVTAMRLRGRSCECKRLQAGADGSLLPMSLGISHNPVFLALAKGWRRNSD